MDLLLISELCSKIKETELYQNLKKAELELENNQDLFPLFSKYQMFNPSSMNALKQNLDVT